MDENGKKVTIQDIADSLGISRNTVSKAINNSEGLAEATRDKILKRAVEMGYKQFSYVSTLKNLEQERSLQEADPAKMNGEIALLTTSLISYNHFASLFLDKFHQEISQLGFTMAIHRISPENMKEMTLPHTFDRSKVKGILCVEVFEYAYSELICSLGIPTLFADGPVRKRGEPLSADMILMDNTTEILRFVNLMTERGLDRIGFVGDYDHCQSFYERYLAYRRAMFTCGKPAEEKFIISIPDRDDFTLAERLDALEEYPDVFICANDFVAIDTMQILSQKDRGLLDQIRFLGFDDSHESRIISPALSTVHIHTQVMAYSAMHLLVSRIKEPSMDYRTIYAATDLILRESTEF